MREVFKVSGFLDMFEIIRKTKIVATLGPTSSYRSIIAELCEAGVDVFRLNFSHGSYETHRSNASSIRFIEQKLNRPLAIMMDLQGPKIRIGVFEEGQVVLKSGAKFTLDVNNEFGNSKRVTLPHPEIFGALKEGIELLLDDGKIKLLVTNQRGHSIETKVLVGGILSNKKGVNIPGVALPISALTEKDKKDLMLVDEIGIDYVAISFVQSADDVKRARDLVDPEVKIISKIEKPKAVENIDSIIEESDAIMIARGDLGVEMPIETVPRIQKSIVKICRTKKKPVIIATQMLESMINNPVPTRAEVSDIAWTVYQGVDAVMLSAESASGKFPVESVVVMNNVIKKTEEDVESRSPHIPEAIKTLRNTVSHESRKDDMIATSVNLAANMCGIKLIAAFTETGKTAINVSYGRPNASIIAMTPNVRTARRMNLVWGTRAILIEDLYNFSQMIQVVRDKLSDFSLDAKSRLAVVVAGIPFRESGMTNIIHICELLSNEEFEKNLKIHDPGKEL
jgi:pyruvate kinase